MTPQHDTLLKVFLFTDLVGSTDIKRRLGDAAVADIIARHDELFRTCLAECGGKEEDNAGDGFFATFDRPSDALRCAISFQSQLATIGEAEKLDARIGIHMGEIVRIHVESAHASHDKLVGLAIDIASRVMSLAQPRQILLTRHAFDSVRQQVAPDADRAEFRWLAHGPYRFKGWDDHIDIFEAGIPGIAPLKPPPDSEKARRAVAPGEDETLGWRPAVGLAVPARKGWVLERRLGEGGFGEVWLARHATMKALRTFKFCFEVDRLRSLKREMTLFRVLREVLGDRDDIAHIYEVKLDASPYYIEMEFAPGGDLYDWSIQQGGIGAVAMELRLELVAQVAEALAAAHRVGVIHKDVKPRNVLINQRPDGRPHARLTDFGIGVLENREQLLAKGITATGLSDSTLDANESSRTGTRLYAAPELIAGLAPTNQSDIFALGVMLYQCSIGDFGRPLAHGWESLVDDELIREDISLCVVGATERRLRNADELARRLRTLPQRRAALVQAQRAAQATARRAKTAQKIKIAAPLLLLLALVAVGSYFYFNRQRESHSAEMAAAQRAAAQAVAEVSARFEAQLAGQRLRGLAGLDEPPAPQPPPEDQSLVDADAAVAIAVTTLPQQLNPMLTTQHTDLLACDLLFERLVTRTADMRLAPNMHLVQSMQIDGTTLSTIQITLQAGVRWHDGEPFTAEDVVYSWRQTLSDPVRSSHKQRAARLADLVATGPLSLVATQKQPLASWMSGLAFELLPKHIYAKQDQDDPTLARSGYYKRVNSKPVGNGPFQWVPGDDGSLTLSRWPFYSGQKPHVERVIFRQASTPNEKLAALLNGSVDIVDLSVEQFQNRANEEFRAAAQADWRVSDTVYYILWNQQSPRQVFNDGRVRAAMAHALDLERINAEVGHNLFSPCYGLFPADSAYFDPQARRYKYDLSLATQLLGDAGWTRQDSGPLTRKDSEPPGVPLRFDLMIAAGKVESQGIARIVKETLAKLGVAVSVVEADWASEFQTRQRRGDFSALIGSFDPGLARNDPDQYRARFMTGMAHNFGGYSNPAVDAAFDAALLERDTAKRDNLYRDIQRMVYEDQPMCFVCYRPSLWAYSKRLRGVQFSSRGPFLLTPGVRDWWVAR